MTLKFISSNANKSNQVREYLPLQFETIEADLHEIQSLDITAIAATKASEAFQRFGAGVFVEDVALSLHAQQGLPGPFIKWYLKQIGAEGICRMADAYNDRSATASICYAYHDGTKVHLFTAHVQGQISNAPLGSSFGFDNVFIPLGFTLTRGQLFEEDKEAFHATSHRRKALESLYLHLHH